MKDRLTCVAAFIPYSFTALKINIDSLFADSAHSSDFPVSIIGFGLVMYLLTVAHGGSHAGCRIPNV